MSSSGIIMAIVSLGITWGGFAICLRIASKQETEK